MNTKQINSLNLFLSTFSTVRANLVPAGETVKHTETVIDGKCFVSIDLPGFPSISIGKSGGFDIPAVKSYPQNGLPNSLAFPGNTALDAALWADLHMVKQSGPRKPRTKAVGAIAAPVTPVVDAFAMVPAVVEVTPVASARASRK